METGDIKNHVKDDVTNVEDVSNTEDNAANSVEETASIKDATSVEDTLSADAASSTKEAASADAANNTEGKRTCDGHDDEPLIRTAHLTKDYGHGRGVFDITLEVNRGECFGFLGPNGAGKTTVIRHLMGFSRPQEGTTSICGLDSWKNAAKLQKSIGYLPGEIALPDNMTGTAFLRMMEKMRGMKNDDHLNMLLKTFELDPNISTRSMSLGVKRKLAVVVAFMHDPAILILDEPTSGLDPVMQQVFIDFVLREKTRGKTIFLSSHLFNEVDATCDRIAIIKDGHLVSQFDTDEFRNRGERFYRIALGSDDDFKSLTAQPYDFAELHPRTRHVKVHVNDSEISHLIDDIADLDVIDFEEAAFTLEDYFMQFYHEDSQFEEVG